MKRKYTLRDAVGRSAVVGAASIATLLSQAGLTAADAAVGDGAATLKNAANQELGCSDVAQELPIWRVQACYVRGDKPKCYVRADKPKCYVRGDSPKCYVHG